MSSDEELHDQEPASPGPEEEEVNVDEVDDETLRIMVSTDNHLGYAEKDPIRGMDSFAAFEEVLYLAKRHKVRAVQMAQFVARNFFVFFVLDTFLCFSHDSASVAGTHPHHHMIGDVPKPIGWATSGNGALGWGTGTNCSWSSNWHRTLVIFQDFHRRFVRISTRPTNGYGHDFAI